MNKFSLVLLVVCACFLASGADAQQVCASVHLGGADINWDGEGAPPNNDSNLSLGAIERCDGTVRGQVQDKWAGVGPVHGKVSCLVVDGNNAWVSGIISAENTSDGAAEAGQGFFVRVVDNGKNRKQDTPDQASFFYSGDTIDEFECYNMWDVAVYDLNNGQATVQ